MTKVVGSIRNESQVRNEKPPKRDNLNVACRMLIFKSENTYFLENLAKSRLEITM